METLHRSDHGLIPHAQISPTNAERETSFPTAYWVISPDLIGHCSAPLLRFLATLADEFGCDSRADGSTRFTITYRGRDASKRIADRTGIADRTVDRRLAELQQLPEVILDYADTGDMLTITLPAIGGQRRPQVPKNIDLSGRALRVWVALQLTRRGASTAQLAEVLDCSPDTITRGETELEKAGLLLRERHAGKAHNRELVGLIRRVGTLRRSGGQPSAEVALFHSLKQRSYKGPPSPGPRSIVPERITGHTRETSSFDQWELLDPSELEALQPSLSSSPATSVADIRSRMGWAKS